MTASSSGVEFHIYREFAEIPLDELSWDKLVEDADVGGVFLQYFWVSNWWKHFGHAYQLFFVTAESSAGVLAFAPLMIDEKGTLRFIGDLNSDYLGFVIPLEVEDLISDFVRFLSESKDKWRVMHLRNICRRGNSNHTFLEVCRRFGLRPWNNYSVSAPYLQIAENDEELQALSSKYSFRRADRLLKEQGPLRFEVFSTNDRAAHFWDIFALQHVKRCKRDGRTSTFSSPDYLPFLKSLYESDVNRTLCPFFWVVPGRSSDCFSFWFSVAESPPLVQTQLRYQYTQRFTWSRSDSQPHRVRKTT